jgi:hypothetical protein
MLAAQSFQAKFKTLLIDIIQCPSNTDTQVSRHFGERERGAFYITSAFNGVIEPHMGGHLHWYIAFYGSVLIPTILSRLASGSSDLKKVIENLLNSISCTSLSKDTQTWYKKMDVNYDSNAPIIQATHIQIPSAADNY